MEPISASASALTILGTLSTTVQSAVDIKNSSKDLQKLHSELNYLQAIAGTLYTLAQTLDLTPVHITVIQHPLNKVRDAQKLFNKCFSKQNNAGVSKPEFKRTVHRNKIRKLKKELDAVGQSFNTTLATIGWLKLSTNSYRLELSPTFSQEHYVSAGPMLELPKVYSAIEVRRTATLRVHKHFLLFAQHRRRWRQIVATTATRTQSDFIATGKIPLASQQRALGLLLDLIRRTLTNSQGQLCEHVASLDIELDRSSLGSTSLIRARAILSTSLADCISPNNGEIVQQVLHRGLPVILEAQVVVIEQLTGSWDLVRVGSQHYLERIIPFSDQYLSVKDDPTYNFWQSVQNLLQMQGSRFIAKFAGAFLDETRTKLCGYLVILPERSSLDPIFQAAHLAGIGKSWEWKAKWIRQLAVVVNEAHRRGVVIGQFNPNRLWLDENDDLVLVDFTSTSDDIQGFLGNIPPEFRNGALGDFVDPAPGHELTFSSDSFFLGTALWLICEERHNTGGGIFCRRSPCTSLYTYCCTAPHHDQIELQPVSMKFGIPACVETIIKACRQEEPLKRPTAARVLQILTDGGTFESRPTTQQIPIKINLRDSPLLRTWCSECGKICNPEIYSCSTCDQGEFDLFKHCFLQSVPCWDAEHQMYRRALQNNQWVFEKID